ncbi:MAG: TRAP transporter large permease subunit [Arcobacter sp.]|uniref:TRAP transporter large permease subunit n=1 Tax=Arcobacter sp. TaxID=1872629 RepID=UPI003B008A7B
MKNYLNQIFISLFLILTFAISSFAKDSVTIYLDEVVLDKKELVVSIYGSAESEDFDSHKWQVINIEVTDSKANTLNIETQSDKRGLWEVEDLDISNFSDGEISITATMVNEVGQQIGTLRDNSTIKDTSFKLREYLKEHLAISIFVLMVILLLSGFPMMIPLIAGTTLGIYLLFDGDFSKMEFLIQQMMGGIRPAALIAVPMFILSADIMTRGKSAEKLIDFVMAFVRHIKGGLAVSTAGACAMFGAVSGSTQATVVAIGSPLRPRLKKGGYKDSFILALIVNSSDIAFLIPPSIGI